MRKAIENLLDDDDYDDGSYGAQQLIQLPWLWLLGLLGRLRLSPAAAAAVRCLIMQVLQSAWRLQHQGCQCHPVVASLLRGSCTSIIIRCGIIHQALW